MDSILENSLKELIILQCNKENKEQENSLLEKITVQVIMCMCTLMLENILNESANSSYEPNDKCDRACELINPNGRISVKVTFSLRQLDESAAGDSVVDELNKWLTNETWNAVNNFNPVHSIMIYMNLKRHFVHYLENEKYREIVASYYNDISRSVSTSILTKYAAVDTYTKLNKCIDELGYEAVNCIFAMPTKMYAKPEVVVHALEEEAYVVFRLPCYRGYEKFTITVKRGPVSYVWYVKDIRLVIYLLTDIQNLFNVLNAAQPDNIFTKDGAWPPVQITLYGNNNLNGTYMCSPAMKIVNNIAVAQETPFGLLAEMTLGATATQILEKQKNDYEITICVKGTSNSDRLLRMIDYDREITVMHLCDGWSNWNDCCTVRQCYCTQYNLRCNQVAIVQSKTSYGWQFLAADGRRYHRTHRLRPRTLYDADKYDFVAHDNCNLMTLTDPMPELKSIAVQNAIALWVWANAHYKLCTIYSLNTCTELEVDPDQKPSYHCYMPQSAMILREGNIKVGYPLRTQVGEAIYITKLGDCEDELHYLSRDSQSMGLCIRVHNAEHKLPMKYNKAIYHASCAAKPVIMPTVIKEIHEWLCGDRCSYGGNQE